MVFLTCPVARYGSGSVLNDGIAADLPLLKWVTLVRCHSHRSVCTSHDTTDRSHRGQCRRRVGQTLPIASAGLLASYLEIWVTAVVIGNGVIGHDHLLSQIMDRTGPCGYQCGIRIDQVGRQLVRSALRISNGQDRVLSKCSNIRPAANRDYAPNPSWQCLCTLLTR
jgi:hypothetical protein